MIKKAASVLEAAFHLQAVILIKPQKYNFGK